MTTLVRSKVQEILNENINRVFNSTDNKYSLLLPDSIIQTINKMAIERMNMCFLEEVSDNDILFATNDWLLFALQKVNGQKLSHLIEQKLDYSIYTGDKKTIDLLIQKVLNISEFNKNSRTYYMIPDDIINELNKSIRSKESEYDILSFLQKLIDLYSEYNIVVVEEDNVTEKPDKIPMPLFEKIFGAYQDEEIQEIQNINNKEEEIEPISKKGFLPTIEDLLNEVEYQILNDDELKKAKKMVINLLYQLEQK